MLDAECFQSQLSFITELNTYQLEAKRSYLGRIQEGFKKPHLSCVLKHGKNGSGSQGAEGETECANA